MWIRLLALILDVNGSSGFTDGGDQTMYVKIIRKLTSRFSDSTLGGQVTNTKKSMTQKELDFATASSDCLSPKPRQVPILMLS